jgi:uncharacterized protein RhaS with RHS repeats
MSARHYSPVTGRFLQPDPSALEDNLYAYVADNPATFVDPSGIWYWGPTWYASPLVLELEDVQRIRARTDLVLAVPDASDASAPS